MSIAYQRWVVVSAVFLASCSQGGSPGPTGPNGPSVNVAAPVDDGVVVGLAAGDVTSGPGSLEMFNLRMDRQTSAGVSVLRQYANPGGDYPFTLGETIELWAEYRGTTGNPRFKVNWGDGESDAINCGSCLIKHVYRRGGRFTVTATLDDQVNTTVTRTFQLFTASDSDFGCGTPASITSFAISVEEESTNTPADADFDEATSAAFGPVAGASRVAFACTEGCNSDLAGHLSGGDEGDLFVEVHNPETGAWVRVFSQHVLSSDAESFFFDGLVIDFPNESAVDQVRLAGTPVGSTYHGWYEGTFTITVSCR